LEQFPEFSGTVKTILLDYKELLNRAIDSDNESLRSTYETYNSIIMALQTELDKDTLSFDERKYIIEQMKDIANAVDKKDSENKKWLTKMAMIAGATVVGVAAVLGSVLGTNTNFQQIDTDNANTDDEND
jgi:CII-binding regulator of phage lambda lysogenization HflD